MQQKVAAAGCVLLAASCSLIYDPGNIGTGSDAATDGAIDAAILDGDPTKLSLDGVSPAMIYEGQGDGSSREALLVISGNFIAADAQVAISVGSGAGAGSAMFVVDAAHVQVALDGRFIAVPIALPVNPGFGSASAAQLTVTVSQPVPGGGSNVQTLANAVTLVGLDEMTSQAQYGQLLYSQIMLGSATTWTGNSTSPVILRATSSIAVADISANGTAAVKTTPGAGGPGGCPGGSPGATGGCSSFPGGGGPGGAAAGGGGGGGFAMGGDPGGGSTGGDAGAQTGSAQLGVLVDPSSAANTNRASGGGGGGFTTATAGVGMGTGGAGGGGGGAVVLEAGGSITVTNVNVLGGAGGAGQTGGLDGKGGAGGGGAGGAVVLRTTNASVALAGTVALTGGGGGSGGGGGGGGAGSPGRFRVDEPMGTPPANAHRGLAFAPGTPLVFAQASPAIMVLGTLNDSFDVNVQDATGAYTTATQPVNQTFSTGPLTIHPALSPGFNHLCLTIHGATRGGELADTCIDVAYLP